MELGINWFWSFTNNLIDIPVYGYITSTVKSPM